MSVSSNQPLQVNQLPISVDFPKNIDQLVEMLSLLTKQMINTINTKEGSLYSLQELGNFQQYYTIGDANNFRNAYRRVYDLVNLNGGNIGASATVSFPSSIIGEKYSAGVIAYCTSVAGASPTNNDRLFSVIDPYVWLNRSAHTVNFTNPKTVALESVIVVAEYLKN